MVNFFPQKNDESIYANLIINKFIDCGFYVLCKTERQIEKDEDSNLSCFENFLFKNIKELNSTKDLENSASIISKKLYDEMKKEIDKLNKNEQLDISSIYYIGNNKIEFKEFLFENFIFLNTSINMFLHSAQDEKNLIPIDELINIVKLVDNNEVINTLDNLFKEYFFRKKLVLEEVEKILDIYKESMLDEKCTNEISKLLYVNEKNKKLIIDVYNLVSNEKKMFILLHNSLSGCEFFENEWLKKVKNTEDVRCLKSLAKKSKDKNSLNILEFYKNGGVGKYDTNNKKFSVSFLFDKNKFLKVLPHIDEDVFENICNHMTEKASSPVALLNTATTYDEELLIVISSDIEMNNEHFEEYIFNHMPLWIKEYEKTNVEITKVIEKGLLAYPRFVREENLQNIITDKSDSPVIKNKKVKI